MGEADGAGHGNSVGLGEPDSRERFADADHVLHGPDGARLVQKVLYAVYVAAALTLVFGFALLRAVLISTDTLWVRQYLADWRGIAMLGLVVGGLVVGAWWAGRVRGPATPPLVWIDLAVASSIDRAVALRPWWRMVLAGAVGCAAITGGVVGGALVAADLAAGWAIPAGIVGGATLTLGFCLLWLSSAAVHAPPGDRPTSWQPRTSELLRSLRLETLRDHARRTQQLTGAVLAGDPRAARLQVAVPITTGRRLRLLAGGAALTTVRRDLLGLRRQPSVALAALVLSACGAWLLAMTILDRTTPIPVTVIGLALCQCAIGLWSQGLRYCADSLSSPPLFGLPVVRRAALHSVVPALAHLIVTLPVALIAWAALGHGAPSLPILLTAFVALAPELIAGHWWSAFRSPPPPQAFIPETGPIMLIFFIARPWLVILTSGSLALHRLALSPIPWVSVVMLALVGAGMLWVGTRMAKRLADDGR